MQLLVARAAGAQRELVHAVTREARMGMAVDEARDRAQAACVELIDLALDLREITHPSDAGNGSVLAEDIGILDHVDLPQVRAAQRTVATGRSRDLNEIADQQAARPAVTTHSSDARGCIGTSSPCCSAVAIASA